MLNIGARSADNQVVTGGDIQTGPWSRRRYRAVLLVWYLSATVLATANGRFAHSPWPVAGFLFGVLEVATFFFGAAVDDWGSDFRGDYEVWIRGTLANAVIVAVFTAIGTAIPGGRL